MHAGRCCPVHPPLSKQFDSVRDYGTIRRMSKPGRKRMNPKLAESIGSFVANPHRRPDPELIVPTREGRPDPTPVIAEDPRTLEIWDRICGTLEGMEILEVEGQTLLESFCLNYSIMIQAVECIRKEGITVDASRGGVRTNPACTLFTSSVATHKSLLSEFGLTPSSRASMAVPKSVQSADEPIAILMKRLGGG